MSGDDGLSEERGLEVGARDAVDDLGIVGDQRPLDLPADTVLFDGSSSGFYFR